MQSLVVFTIAPDIPRALLAKLLSVIDALPWIPMAGGGLHPLVVCSHPSLTAADDEEVLGWSLCALLPESLGAFLDLLVLSGCEAEAVLLTHHRDRPFTLVEAVPRGGLAIAQQPVQL